MQTRADSILKQILMGGTVDDKLTGFDLNPAKWDWTPDTRFEVPEAPGRVGVLAPREAKKPAEGFPKKSELLGADHLRHRGRLLHYFANHELLAIETMACTLLQFPDAPLEFRQGVTRILQEEQKHFLSYLQAMKKCGAELGDVPLNFYFWNSMKTLQSPFDFVTRMSLTFEQANLDFALEYASFFEKEGQDPDTAKLLRQVHDDEVRHVAHGWYWFQKWKPGQKSSWAAYVDALPFPMSPRRARGSSVFFAEGSRKQAGMDSDYIQEAKISGGSRGRVPDLWWFNPECEIEFLNETLSKGVQEKILDLEPVLFWLAQEDDVIVQSRPTPLEWRNRVFELKGELPEVWICEDRKNWSQSWAESVQRPVQSFQPWGWGKGAREHAEWLGSLIRERGQPVASLETLKTRFSKTAWKQKLKTPGWVCASESDWSRAKAEAAQSEIEFGFLKSEHSTSGRGHKKIQIAESKYPGFSCVLEPFYEKAHDFSVQLFLHPNGRIERTECREFFTDARGQYLGAQLGPPSGPVLHALRAHSSQVEASWAQVIEQLKAENYTGPVGIDGLVTRSGQVVPVIEVNVRWTLGRVAWELEQILRKKGWLSKGGARAQLKLLNKSESIEGDPKDWIEVTPQMTAVSTWLVLTKF